MTLQVTYRADLDRPLTSLEADDNIRSLAVAVETLQESGGGGDAGGIPEAPLDGQSYARNSGTWTVVVGGGGTGIAHAPSDGFHYVSFMGDWVPIYDSPVAEAPFDGVLRGRLDGDWAPVPTAPAGLPEAPSDGVIRGRKDAAWVEIPSGGGATIPLDVLRIRGAWNSSMSIAVNDVVTSSGMVWLAIQARAAPSLQPTFDSNTYWLPMGFPAYPGTGEPVADRIQHRFATATRTDQKRLSQILDSFETRIAALE